MIRNVKKEKEIRELLTNFLRDRNNCVAITACMLDYCKSYEALGGVLKNFSEVSKEKVELIFDIVITSKIEYWKAEHIIAVSENALKVVQSLNTLDPEIGKKVLETMGDLKYGLNEHQTKVLSDKLVMRQPILKKLLATKDYYDANLVKRTYRYQ